MGAGANPRWRQGWVLGGTVLLGLLVLIAVFSLGVYVGRRGWDAGPPSVAGPVQPPQGPGQLPGDQQPPEGQPPPGGQAAQPWPQDQPSLVGLVRTINADGIVVNTDQGPRFVRVTEETRFVRLTQKGEVEIEAQALQPRQGVAVFGPWSPDGRALTAERIVLLPPN